MSLHSDNVRRTQEILTDRVGAGRVRQSIIASTPRSRRGVDAFAQSPIRTLSFAGSADGRKFAPLASDHKAFSAGQGDYGYLVPVLFQGTSGAATDASPHRAAGDCPGCRAAARFHASKSITAGRKDTERGRR